MAKDIVPELLGDIQEQFKENLQNSDIIKKDLQALFDKKATYKEANSFSIEVGEVLSKALQDNVTADILPDGKMYYNIASRLMNETLQENYKLVSEYSSVTQTILNESAGIGFKGEVPKLNQDRINGLIEKLVDEEDFEKTKWVLQEPIVNFSQSIVDDTIKVNAKLHSDLGMKPQIIRIESGNCCDWCKSLAGKYDYPDDVPKDVYRRHRYCRCTVEYVPDKSKRQNIFNKKWVYNEESKVEERIQRNKNVKEINRKDDLEQYKNYIKILGYENVPESFTLFQEMKYNDAKRYEQLRDRAYIQNNFNKGIWKDKINIDKQARHMQSTAGENKSYFYDNVDVERLYDEYKMTGVFRSRRGIKENNYELIDLHSDKDIGVDYYTGNRINGFTIHYSKNGSHIIPTYYEEE